MITCPNCGGLNNEGDKFCKLCGTPMATTSQSVIETVVPEQSQSVPQYPPQQNRQMFSQQSPQYPPIQQQGYGQQPLYSPQGQGYQPNPYSSQKSVANIWGPFAGYGVRHEHDSWVLDNKGEKADELVQSIQSQFAERQIPQATVRMEYLTAKGLIVERRPFFILRRGLVNIALYVNKFGKDLYISTGSYIKPPLSNFKLISHAVLLVVCLFITWATSQSLLGIVDAIGAYNIFSGVDPLDIVSNAFSGSFLFSLCCLNPLAYIGLLYMFYVVIQSVIDFIRYKDILMEFRVDPNEFNVDDLKAMELAVRQTVKLAMDQIGLDYEDLVQSEVQVTGKNRRII